MFVLNVKFNFKKVVTVLIAISIVTAAGFEFVNSKINNPDSLETGKDNVNYDYILSEENYTTHLKEIHDNIDGNLNKTIKVSGFVFKKDDFSENVFVCGMNTIINDEENVAGILCESLDTSSLKDNEWIEITGIISKGEYNGIMPIVKVFSIKKIEAPKNTYVS